MKVVLLSLLLSLCTFAAEPLRVWTDVDGRKIEAILKSKTEKEIEVLLLNGKLAKIRLDRLSDGDREYVLAADLEKDDGVKVSVKSSIIHPGRPGEEDTYREVFADVKGIKGGHYFVAALLVGEKGGKPYVIDRRAKDIKEDANVRFLFQYLQSDGKVGENYGGLLIVVLTMENRVVAKVATDKKYLNLVKDNGEGAFKVLGGEPNW